MEGGTQGTFTLGSMPDNASIIETWYKAGVPESVVMKMTGHETREMFYRYNTVDHDDARRAVDRLEDFLQTENDLLSKPLSTEEIEK